MMERTKNTISDGRNFKSNRAGVTDKAMTEKAGSLCCTTGCRLTEAQAHSAFLKQSEVKRDEMSILGQVDKKTFMENYWQQKPLLVRNASSEFANTLSAEELAGLSMEDDVESRIIVRDSNDDSWHLQQGPFDSEDFQRLPETDWTLLVQAVDHWLPEVAEVLSRFDFLPRWRLEDVMISYATKGGGVGAHFDYYDVFLLQVNGRRRWRLGQHCDEASPIRGDQPLRLLESFNQTEDHALEPGDMLYVPAGLAHWGTAEDDDCMTWSIGFRAPAAADLLISAAEHIATTLPANLRYRDGAGQRGGAEITDAVDKALDTLFSELNKEDLMSAIKKAFSAQITEPQYAEPPELLDSDTLDELLEGVKRDSYTIERAPASRFAFSRSVDTKGDSGEFVAAELYVDGLCYQTSVEYAKMISELTIELYEEALPLIRRLLEVGALIVVS